MMKKRGFAMLMCAVMLLTGFYIMPSVQDTAQASSRIVRKDKEMRGLWIAFCDFKSLGLYNKNKKTFRKNVDRIMKKAKGNKLNTVFVHARSFDDAIWKSKTFDASPFLVSSAKAKLRAYHAYSYDPMKIFCHKARKYGLEVHAWLNPYRITYSKFLNPKFSSSRKRVQTAVKELSKYDIDGIHFDDYFYHSAGGYVKKVSASPSYISPSSATKRKNVNKLMKGIYNLCHKRKLTFGVSPAGNYDNDMHDGADVKTWLGNRGYADYVAPQIYWTDNYGGGISMFTDRLNQFARLNKHPKKIRMYIGLALYNTGRSIAGDPGWASSNKNLKRQVKKIRRNKYRKRGINGFIHFEANNLYMKRCKK